MLGNRALEEPDEGRYAEIAREMIETRDWLVPHLWYLPHFDKPPMTYWLVAASMKLFGQNEWAVRLPVAMAALSGVIATWLFGCSIGGRRTGFWSVLILQTSLLYFAMARLLTTDIFLTQFVAWAIYFLWRSWCCLQGPPASAKRFWFWHLAGWLAIALGFLTKGPVALAIPLVAVLSLTIFRWGKFSNKGLLFAGIAAGLALFFALASPWFLIANRAVPGTLNYMLFHQAAGHVLGTTIHDRRGFPFYFFVVLALGLLPWTWLLGWLWRRSHWRELAGRQKEAWVMLNAWAIFTFTLFSLTHSKLAAYILPLFPAAAVMLAFRFFDDSKALSPAPTPRWIWRWCAVSPLVLLAGFSLALAPLYHVTVPGWMNWQACAAIAGVVIVFWLAKKWPVSKRAGWAAALASVCLMAVAGEVKLFEADFGSNQTLKPLGRTLRDTHRDGDVLVFWKQLPEGLPFYAHGIISPTNRPFFGGMNLAMVPFEFPGNQQRLGSLLLPSEEALEHLLAGNGRVLIVIQANAFKKLQTSVPSEVFRVLAVCGRWELVSNH